MAGDLSTTWRENTETGGLTVGELLTLAETMRQSGNRPAALELYRTWLDANPADPLRHAIAFNFGIGLSDSGDFPGAIKAFEMAVLANPDFYPAYINLGTALERIGAGDQAVLRWLELVNRLGQVTGDAKSHKLIALQQIARVFETARIDKNAETVMRQIMDLDVTRREVNQHFINLQQKQCKWPVLQPFGAVTLDVLKGSFFPLNLALYADDPAFQLANAYYHNKTDVGLPAGIVTAGGWAPPENSRKERLKVAYLSSDMRGHAVGYLTVEAFECHNAEAVETYIYYCGIRVRDDPIQERIKSAVDHWMDVNDLDDRQLARQILEDGIDILVDLNGYSMNARTRALALRPAPIIVNWLGYPGTMGSPYHNYIIADNFLIPPEFEIYYSEKVMRLDCYQPNDSKREIAALAPDARASEGLPPEGFVYCCLNGPQKITAPAFARWMRILHEVPGSVLWLLQGGEETDQRLRDQARAHDVDPARLVFSERKANADHLARYRLADLFLDTFPYVSHTTASDALWMCVPILTMPGLGFASRVCGSILQAVGLGELICETPETYVARAIELGRDPGKVKNYKLFLENFRRGSAIFDTPSMVRKLERLYRFMWDEFSRGDLPKPDLRNLEIYRRAGMAIDHDLVEIMPHDAYQAHFRRMLAQFDGVLPLPPDDRLWPAEK